MNNLMMVQGSTKNASAPTTVTDGSGNVYSVVQIGTQHWTATNLNTTKLADGTDLINSISSEFPAWSNADVEGQGKLYNGHAAISAIAPPGWRVPTQADWNTIIAYYGGYAIAGGWLDNIGLSAPPFDVVPSGLRLNDVFYSSSTDTGFWTSNVATAIGPNLVSSRNNIYMSTWARTDSLSIRLIWAG